MDFDVPAWVEISILEVVLDIQMIISERDMGLGVERESLLKGLLNEFWPVPKGASHHATVDEVESVSKSPCLFQIVNLELEIWWDTLTGVSYI